jgi:hypothetical protein
MFWAGFVLYNRERVVQLPQPHPLRSTLSVPAVLSFHLLFLLTRVVITKIRAFYPLAQEVPFKEGLLSGQLLTTRLDQQNAYPSVSKTLP